MTSFTSTQQIVNKSIAPSPADSNTLISYKKTSTFRTQPNQSISERNSLSSSFSMKNIPKASPADSNLSRSLSGKSVLSATKRVPIKPQTPPSVGPGSYTLPSCFSQKQSSMSFKFAPQKLAKTGELALSGNEFRRLSTSHSGPQYSLGQRPKTPENKNPAPNKYEVKNNDRTNSRIAKQPSFVIPQCKKREVFPGNSNPGVGSYQLAGGVGSGAAGFSFSNRNYKE